MAKIIKMGSLLYDNRRVSIITKYRGERIDFGDTVPGSEIPFLKWRGMYVAAKTICLCASWKELHKQGLIFGRTVTIDGDMYFCRSLKTGSLSGMPSEWDAILDEFEENNRLLHWKQYFFWGQENRPGEPSVHIVRGGYSAHYRATFHETTKGTTLGLRPVLEPMFSSQQISEELIGRKLKIYGRNDCLSGVLVGYDNYDLELKAEDLLSACAWARTVNGSVFVDRDAVECVRVDG